MLERASSVPRGSERLAERRRVRRRRWAIAFSILLVFAFGALDWGLWQSSVRISRITVYGADASFAEYAKNEMQGSYFGIIPRDSIFFFPASSIRADILAAHPDVAAVSLFREGLASISIKMNERTPIARWCGSLSAPQAASSTENCYLFDANGLIYATTSTAQLVNTFLVFSPLEGEGAPLGATLSRADELPAVFDFARRLDSLGSPVAQVVIRADEVDDHLASGTRITYVLGHEQDAFTALVSAHDNLNLKNGSIEYVDLRFDGKVYLKRRE